MKSFVLLIALLTVASVIVLAVVFRSRPARNLLRLALRTAYVWIAIVILAAAYRLWQGGL